eukprot:scaffold195736_cov27-Tisochrysis_lutea.AAC.3
MALLSRRCADRRARARLALRRRCGRRAPLPMHARRGAHHASSNARPLDTSIAAHGHVAVWPLAMRQAQGRWTGVVAVRPRGPCRAGSLPAWQRHPPKTASLGRAARPAISAARVVLAPPRPRSPATC